MRSNRETEYGKEHAFSEMTDADTFAKRVPVNTFSGLAPYVERMKDGERNVLTADQPVMFNLTSGTTDQPKYLPVTQRGMALTAGAASQWLYRALEDHPSLLDHSFLCISSASVQGRTRSQIPYGSASGMIYRNLPHVLRRSFALPFAVSDLRDYALRYYVMARIALGKELSFIATPNPTTLIKIAETGIQHEEEIVRSIHDGFISCTWPFDLSREDSRVLSLLGASLRPNRARASSLQQVIEQQGKLVPSACWPELKLIGCWLGGSIGFQADKLFAYFGESVPKRDIGYLASEGWITIPYQDNTPAGILALHNNYYEFIPEHESIAPGTPALRCHELEQGKRYRIILTSPNGLYRYDIHDVIEVQGFYAQAPLIAFLRKGNDMLNIIGEKLHVNHLVKALRSVKDEHGVTVTHFRAVPNHEEVRHEMLMHIESAPSEELLRNAILPCIDSALSEANVEYAAKRKSKRLGPPCIHVMAPSWAEAVRRAGRSDIQYKWQMVARQMSDLDARHIRHTVEM